MLMIYDPYHSAGCAASFRSPVRTPVRWWCERLPLILLAALFVPVANAQDPQLVKDSVMNVYMESGKANTLFEPRGKTDKKKLRQGPWKDYRVEHDFAVFARKDHSKRIQAHYLIYGEGEFVDGKREGPWRCYTIEDKTFKHFPYKQVTYVQGVEQGPVTYTFPDGRTGFEATYVNGQLEGTSTLFYDDGKVNVRMKLVNDHMDSVVTAYHRNGDLKFTKCFVNDTANGAYIGYYPGGQVEERSTYTKGELDGVYQYFHSNGQLWVERQYDRGRVMNVTGNYSVQGEARDPGTLKDGNGTLIFYDGEGKIYLVKTYKDGVLVGEEKR